MKNTSVWKNGKLGKVFLLVTLLAFCCAVTFAALLGTGVTSKSGVAYAEDAPAVTITATAKEGTPVGIKAGDTVVIEYKLTVNGGINSLQLELAYDTNIFDYTSVSFDNSIFSSGYEFSGTEDENFTLKRYFWNGAETTASGLLFKVTYTVKNVNAYTPDVAFGFNDIFSEATYHDADVSEGGYEELKYVAPTFIGTTINVLGSATLSVTAGQTFVYDTNAITATEIERVVKDSASETVSDGFGELTAHWYADNQGVKGDAIEAPVNAGKYWVSFSAAVGSKYTAIEECNAVAFEITKAVLSNIVLTYDGGIVSWAEVTTTTGGLTVLGVTYIVNDAANTAKSYAASATGKVTIKAIPADTNNYAGTSIETLDAHSVEFVAVYATNPTTIYVYNGQQATKPVDPVDSAETARYTFSKWNVGDTADEYDFATSVDGNLVLKAVWTANKFAIIYKDGDNVLAVAESYPTTYTYGVAVTFPTNNNPTKTGYDFVKWVTEHNGSTEVTGISETDVGDITVYASWNAKTYQLTYVVNFDGKTDNGALIFAQDDGTVPVAFATTVELRAADALQVKVSTTYFRFSGWFTDATLETPAGTYTMGADNATLYGQWVWNVGEGDVNADGNVTALDIELYRKYVVGGWKTTINAAIPNLYDIETGVEIANNGSIVTRAANINNDGDCDLRDISYIRMAIVGGYGYYIYTGTPAGVDGQGIKTIMTASSYDELTTCLDYNQGGVKLVGTIALGEDTFTLGSGKTIDMGSATVNGTIINNGTIIVRNIAQLQQAAAFAGTGVVQLVEGMTYEGDVTVADGITIRGANGNVVAEGASAASEGAVAAAAGVAGNPAVIKGQLTFNGDGSMNGIKVIPAGNAPAALIIVKGSVSIRNCVVEQAQTGDTAVSAIKVETGALSIEASEIKVESVANTAVNNAVIEVGASAAVTVNADAKLIADQQGVASVFPIVANPSANVTIAAAADIEKADTTVYVEGAMNEAQFKQWAEKNDVSVVPTNDVVVTTNVEITAKIVVKQGIAITKEGDVTITNNGEIANAGGSIVVTAGTGKQSVASESNLRAAITGASASTTITLGANINLATAIVITDKEITLDLNGHTISRLVADSALNERGVFIVNGGKLTVDDMSTGALGKVYGISNGKNAHGVTVNGGELILTNGTIGATYGGVYVIGNTNSATIADPTKAIAAKFTVNGGTVTADISDDSYRYAICIRGNGSKLVVNQGNIIGTITGNGNSTDPTNNGYTDIDIYGGIIDGGLETAMYLPQSGTVNISGGTLKGSEAISMKDGILTITGGTFIANGEYYDIVEANNNGTEDTGATISITNNPAYVKDGDTKMSVNISGGSFTSANGYALYEGTAMSDGAFVTTEVLIDNITITGGTFKGADGKEDIHITHDGIRIIEVDSREELLEAVKVNKAVVKLAADITDNPADDLNISSDTQALDFTLDLNGHVLGMELNLRASSKEGVSYGKLLNANIINSGSTGYIGNRDSAWFGIMPLGDSNLTVTMTGVESIGLYGGLYTNGTAYFNGIDITAKNCHFEGCLPTDSAGAYLAGNNTYVFTDCTFNGGTGVYTKSGTHTYTNCTVTGTGAYSAPNYNNNGADSTGSAMVIDNAVGYVNTLDVTIDGGTFTSTNGYGIEECQTHASGATAVDYATVTINSINTTDEIVLLVDTRAELLEAIKVNKAIVKLSADIASEGELNICSDTQALDFTLDLNGHSIFDRISFRTLNAAREDYAYGITARLIDTGAIKGQIGMSTSACYYGIAILSDERLSLTMDGIKSIGYYGGLCTNGSAVFSGSTIVATNCQFEGVNATDSAGAYLPAACNYTFTNCTFKGGNGVYTKSGIHTYTNCTVIGTGAYSAPSYNGNGADPTGSAMVIDNATGYVNTLDVTIDGGTFTSTNGYGIEECQTHASGATAVDYATITINGTPGYTFGAGKTATLLLG